MRKGRNDGRKNQFCEVAGTKEKSVPERGTFCDYIFCDFCFVSSAPSCDFLSGVARFVTGMLFLVWDYRKFAVRHERLQQLSAMPFDVMTDFPESLSVLETDYQQIIVQLQEGQRRMKDEMSFQYQDMMNYYTVWAHQIKTPIAAMRLKSIYCKWDLLNEGNNHYTKEQQEQIELRAPVTHQL